MIKYPKISEAQKRRHLIYPHPRGMLGKHHTKETREMLIAAMKKANTGKHRSIEVLEAMKPTMFRKGRTSWNKGMKNQEWMSEEGKMKWLRAISGKNCILWKGGISGMPGYRTYQSVIRRARMNGNGGSFTLKEWENLKNEYHNMCLCCKKFEPEITLSVDHVIPVVYGGSNNIENIQPLCTSCNSQKNRKTIDFRKVEFSMSKNELSQ